MIFLNSYFEIFKRFTAETVILENSAAEEPQLLLSDALK